MKNKKKLVEILTALAEVLPREKPLSETAMALYWRALERYTDEQVEQAAGEVVLRYKWFPRPAELIELIEGNQEDRAVIAWGKVLNGIATYGAYQSVRFDDPVIHSVIQLMGGWVDACRWRLEELKWKQKEFEKIYRAMQGRKDHPDHLEGLVAIKNGADGYTDAIPRPQIVGDPIRHRRSIGATTGIACAT